MNVVSANLMDEIPVTQVRTLATKILNELTYG